MEPPKIASLAQLLRIVAKAETHAPLSVVPVVPSKRRLNAALLNVETVLSFFDHLAQASRVAKFSCSREPSPLVEIGSELQLAAWVERIFPETEVPKNATRAEGVESLMMIKTDDDQRRVNE
jgi:hypothetical protein